MSRVFLVGTVLLALIIVNILLIGLLANTKLLFGVFISFPALVIIGTALMLYYRRKCSQEELIEDITKRFGPLSTRLKMYYSVQFVRVMLPLVALLFFSSDLSLGFFYIFVQIIFILDLIDGALLLDSYFSRFKSHYRIIDWIADYMSFGALLLFSMQIWPELLNFSLYWFVGYPFITLISFYIHEAVLFKISNLILPVKILSEMLHLPAIPGLLFFMGINPILESQVHLSKNKYWTLAKKRKQKILFYVLSCLTMLCVGILLFYI